MPRRPAGRSRAPWAHGVTLAVLGLLLGASPSALGAPDPIGARRCGTCHVKEYEDWKASPHAQALARLSEPKQRDPVCRSCHTTAPAATDPELAGVQCESCHGLGSLYAPRYVMKDEKLRRLLGLEKVTAATCQGCHDGETPSTRPFDFATWVKLVNHGAGASTPAAEEGEGS
jgi:hypothetical protein